MPDVLQGVLPCLEAEWLCWKLTSESPGLHFSISYLLFYISVGDILVQLMTDIFLFHNEESGP